MNQYRSEVRPPSHDELTQLWSSTVEVHHQDVAAVIVPRDDGIVTLALPGQSESLSIGQAVMQATELAIVEGYIEGPCEWLAVAAPAFVEDPPTDRTVVRTGELQRLYMAGDDTIRQVLVVLSMEYGKAPTGTVYTQPLLEVLHPTSDVGVDGLTFSMFLALCTLNS